MFLIAFLLFIKKRKRKRKLSVGNDARLTRAFALSSLSLLSFSCSVSHPPIVLFLALLHSLPSSLYSSFFLFLPLIAFFLLFFSFFFSFFLSSSCQTMLQIQHNLSPEDMRVLASAWAPDCDFMPNDVSFEWKYVTI